MQGNGADLVKVDPEDCQLEATFVSRLRHYSARLSETSRNVVSTNSHPVALQMYKYDSYQGWRLGLSWDDFSADACLRWPLTTTIKLPCLTRDASPGHDSCENFDTKYTFMINK